MDDQHHLSDPQPGDSLDSDTLGNLMSRELETFHSGHFLFVELMVALPLELDVGLLHLVEGVAHADL